MWPARWARPAAPPEQYQGLATPQSDLYALGATLHRLLTGHDPEAHAEAGGGLGIPPAQSLNPSIPPALAEVVARALDPVPAARYATSAQMGAALLDAGRRPANGAYPLRPRPRASRVWFGLVAVCLLLAVIGVLRIGPGPSGRVPVATAGAAPQIATEAASQRATEAAAPTLVAVETALPTAAATEAVPSTPAPVLSPPPISTVPVGTVAVTSKWWTRCRTVIAPLNGGLSPLTVSTKGDVWFAIVANEVIGHLDLSGRAVLCKLPVPGPANVLTFEPSSVSAGTENTIWFTNSANDSIGTADGQLRRIALPILGHPSEAITDQAGNLWFAQQVEGVGVSRILRLMPLGQLTIYTITGNGVPTSLAADRDGSIWFLRSVSALIWHLDPSGSISSFPSGVDRVADIAPDSQGGIWYISDGFSIGHLRTNGTSVRYPIPEALLGQEASAWIAQAPSGSLSTGPAPTVVRTSTG